MASKEPQDKTYILRKPIFIAENYDDDPDG